MALPGSDEPSSISEEEARQELFGRGPSKVGLEAYEVIAIVLGIVGGAVVVDQVENWGQWLLLAAIIVVVLGLIVALNPDRRE